MLVFGGAKRVVCAAFTHKQKYPNLDFDRKRSGAKVWALLMGPSPLKNRTRNAQIFGNCLGWKEPRPIVESPYLVSSDQNLTWDIFVVDRFRNFERFWTVAKRTPEA